MSSLIDSVYKDIRYVIKRSGDKVVFKSEKIETAILNAMKSIGEVIKTFLQHRLKIIPYHQIILCRCSSPKYNIL